MAMTGPIMLAYGQIATLAPSIAPSGNITTPPATTPPQCLDFDKDGICEFIVLANGTMVENPNTVKQTQVANTNTNPLLPAPVNVKAPVKGKCLGMANTAHFCENVILANGTMVKNPNNPSLLTVEVDPRSYYSYPTSGTRL